jgi:hypothetical protein
MDKLEEKELEDSYLEESEEDDQHKPMVDWKNPPKVGDLNQDYIDAKQDHATQAARIYRWLDNLNVTGSAKIKKLPGRSSHVPKLIRKQAEWRYASLSEPFLSTEDIFTVSPVTFEDKKGAVQNELILNNQFNTKISKVRFIDEFVRTVVDEGTVIIRTGWKYREEVEEIDVPVYSYEPTQDPQALQLLNSVNEASQSDPEAFASVPEELKQALAITLSQGIPVAPILTGYKKENQTKVTANHPTADICRFFDVVIDPTCMGDLCKAGFVIYSFETSISELEKDGIYHNLDRITVSDHSPLMEPDYVSDINTNFRFKDKPRQKLVVKEYWGFWDIHGTGIVQPIVASYVGDTMIRLEENPYPDKELPFIIVQYLPVKKAVYGEPDGELLEENQKIIGAVTRGMLDVMGRGANGQTGIRKDALDVVNKRKFAKGDDYEFNSNVDPRQAFHMHTYSEIPQSAGTILQMQNAEAESLTGIKAFSNGISGSALGNTATGIRSALDASSKRELGILRRLAEGITQMGRKFISMNAEFLSEEEVVRVSNAEFVPVRRDDLAGNFDLKLAISTAEEDNHKAEELSFLLQTTAQTSDPEEVRMIRAEIARLRKMPDLAKRIEEYQPQRDPLADKEAELRIQLLEAQVQTEIAKTQGHGATAALDQARAMTEQAKARHYNSGSDLKDLEFVEGDTGTTQERKLQQAGAQARSNMELEMLKHNLSNNSTALSK